MSLSQMMARIYCSVIAGFGTVYSVGGAADSHNLPHTQQNKRKYTPKGQNLTTFFPTLIFYFHIHQLPIGGEWGIEIPTFLLSYGESILLPAAIQKSICPKQQIYPQPLVYDLYVKDP